MKDCVLLHCQKTYRLNAMVVAGDNRSYAVLLAQFFPASGNRNGTGLNNHGSNGNYWSSSLNSAANGYNLNFNSSNVNPANNNNRFNGFSVRAVQNLQTPGKRMMMAMNTTKSIVWHTGLHEKH